MLTAPDHKDFSVEFGVAVTSGLVLATAALILNLVLEDTFEGKELSERQDAARVAINRLSQCSFRSVVLEDVDLSGMRMTACRDGSPFDFSHADLTGADFSRADLWDAVFDQAILRDAVFENATLTKASLYRAELERRAAEAVASATLFGQECPDTQGYVERILFANGLAGADDLAAGQVIDLPRCWVLPAAGS